jgi:hydrogenase nickel incorporation protein HypA/HybF
MHELSLVMSIIEIAETETQKNNSNSIEEIELDIGELSGVEMTAFDFAWNQAIRSTLLENAQRKINHIPGEGKCLECDSVFPLHNLYDACPVCNEHFISIQSGKEFRVKSLIVD